MSGWFFTGAAVLAYDLWAFKNGTHTMSAAWGRWLDHRVGRPACIAGWALLTAHLFAPLARRKA